MVSNLWERKGQNKWSDKDRFCKTMASVAFAETQIPIDLRLQAKEILSTSNSKQTQLQSFSETQPIARLLYIPEMVLSTNMIMYRKKEEISKLYRWHFIFVVQKVSSESFNCIQKYENLIASRSVSIF